MRRRARSTSALVLLGLGLVACRNPESGTTRGPTKSPADSSGAFLVEREAGTAMRELGTPIRPSTEPLAFPALDTITQAATVPAPPVASQPGAVTLPTGVTQAMVDEGKKVFDTTCFACHGQGGAGGPLAPRLSDSEWLHIDGSYDSIVQLIMTGVAKPLQHPAPMPPRGGAPLTDDQVRAVAAYVFSISR